MVFYQTYTLNGGHVDWSTSLVKAKSLGREQGGDYRVYKWETHDMTTQELILTLLREGNWSKNADCVYDTRYKAEVC